MDHGIVIFVEVESAIWTEGDLDVPTFPSRGVRHGETSERWMGRCGERLRIWEANISAAPPPLHLQHHPPPPPSPLQPATMTVFRRDRSAKLGSSARELSAHLELTRTSRTKTPPRPLTPPPPPATPVRAPDSPQTPLLSSVGAETLPSPPPAPRKQRPGPKVQDNAGMKPIFFTWGSSPTEARTSTPQKRKRADATSADEQPKTPENQMWSFDSDEQITSDRVKARHDSPMHSPGVPRLLWPREREEGGDSGEEWETGRGCGERPHQEKTSQVSLSLTPSLAYADLFSENHLISCIITEGRPYHDQT